MILLFSKIAAKIVLEQSIQLGLHLPGFKLHFNDSIWYIKTHGVAVS